jgi:hypothetical protein
MNRLVIAALVLSMSGCARQSAIIPPPPPLAAEAPAAGPATANANSGPDFLDLKPGWRLRITTPLFRHDASATEEPSAPGTITLKAPEGFAYETAYYMVSRDRAGVLSFEFVSGTVTRDGKPASEPAQRGWKIQSAIASPSARLIYLRRLSGPDHNMAVIGALNASALETLTQAIDNNPEQTCINTADSFCAWVPAGVAVVAERMTTAGTWEPVR